MAKQSKAQKDTMERVMHEFKHGELAMHGGRKVKSRRQAVAIGLREAGASKFASKTDNERSLRRTKRKERQGETARAAAGALWSPPATDRWAPNSGMVEPSGRRGTVAGRCTPVQAEMGESVVVANAPGR